MHFSIEHLGLASSDPVSLSRWYMHVLGATEVFTDGKARPAFLLETPGGLLIEIYPAASAVDATRDNGVAGWRHVALRVDSIERAKAELESRGVLFSEPIKPAGGGGRVVFFRDPEGNLLHLVERLPGGFVAAV